MKKRFVTTLIALIACLACALSLVACGSNGDKADSVAGKTYLFDGAFVEDIEDREERAQAEKSLNALYRDSTIYFGKDGSFEMTVSDMPEVGTYTQSGATVEATFGGIPQEITVSGDTLTLFSKEELGLAKLTYRLTKNVSNGEKNDEDNEDNEDNENNEGDNNENEDNNQQEPDIFAGKTYVMTDYLRNGQSMFDVVSQYMGESKIVFGENGDCIVTSGKTASATYAINGNTLRITPVNAADGPSQNFAIGENTLTLTFNVSGATITEIFTLQE